MVNIYENKVRQYLENKGYTVLQKGRPDFMCYKFNTHTRIAEDLCFVEVKSSRSPVLSIDQINYLLALGQNNIPICVIHADNNNSYDYFEQYIENKKMNIRYFVGGWVD